MCCDDDSDDDCCDCGCNDGDCFSCCASFITRLIVLGLCIAMLVLACQWKSDMLSTVGQVDPCAALDTGDLDDFRRSVANNIEALLIAAGVMVLFTIFFLSNRCAKKTSLCFLLLFFIIEITLLAIAASKISTSAEYYKSAMRKASDPMLNYDWENGFDICSIAMDRFQSEVKCCSYQGLSEWDETRPSYWAKNIYPPSCCSDVDDHPTDDRRWCRKSSATFFNDLCIDKLNSWIFSKWFAPILWIAIAGFVFEFICTVVTCCSFADDFELPAWPSFSSSRCAESDIERQTILSDPPPPHYGNDSASAPPPPPSHYGNDSASAPPPPPSHYSHGPAQPPSYHDHDPPPSYASFARESVNLVRGAAPPIRDANSVPTRSDGDGTAPTVNNPSVNEPNRSTLIFGSENVNITNVFTDRVKHPINK